LLVNDEKILPMPCITGAATYPDGLREKLQAESGAHFIPAQAWAVEAGSAKAANIVMLGALCKLCGLDKEMMSQAVAECVPPKFAALNLTAFAFGYERV
jgi:indolepyruvate ferredoxin oxidoreductase beta subunit